MSLGRRGIMRGGGGPFLKEGGGGRGVERGGDDRGGEEEEEEEGHTCRAAPRHDVGETPRLAIHTFAHAPLPSTRPIHPIRQISRNRTPNTSPPPMASSSAGPARVLFSFDESSASSTSGTPPPASALPRPPAPTAEDDNGDDDDDGGDDADDEDDPVSSHFRDLDERGNRYFLCCFLSSSCLRLVLSCLVLSRLMRYSVNRIYIRQRAANG